MSGSSEARLYTFSSETETALRKFRLGTSRAATLQACIYSIDKSTYEILRDPHAAGVYTTLDELAEELPEHAPRFVLLSYPTELKDGRKAVPYVLVFYMPVTVGAELRMLYAGAKELVRSKSEVGRVLEAADEDDVRGVGEILSQA